MAFMAWLSLDQPLAAIHAELHCHSNFIFLRGASSAHEFFERVKRHGYRYLSSG